MLGLFLITFLLYIIYTLYKWNKKMEKKLSEFEKKTFREKNYFLEQYSKEIFNDLNKSKTPRLDQYLYLIKKTSAIIDIDEEKKYFKKIKDGCDLTLEKFVRKKLFDVTKIVNELNDNGLHPELINIGNKALIKSCKTFQGGDGFEKYSREIISNYIKEELKLNKNEYKYPFEEKTLKHVSRKYYDFSYYSNNY